MSCHAVDVLMLMFMRIVVSVAVPVLAPEVIIAHQRTNCWLCHPLLGTRGVNPLFEV